MKVNPPPLKCKKSERIRKRGLKNFSIHSKILTASKVAFFKFLQVRIQLPTVRGKSSFTSTVVKAVLLRCKHLNTYNTVHKYTKVASGYVLSRKYKSVDTFFGSRKLLA